MSNYANLNRSKGNYIVDADGNTMLDLGGNGDLNPLGYNHDLYRNAIKSKEFDNSLINGYSADHYSSASFISKVNEKLGAVAPAGL